MIVRSDNKSPNRSWYEKKGLKKVLGFSFSFWIIPTYGSTSTTLRRQQPQQQGAK